MSNWFTKLFGGNNKTAAVEPKPLETPVMPEMPAEMPQEPAQPENRDGGEAQTS